MKIGCILRTEAKKIRTLNMTRVIQYQNVSNHIYSLTALYRNSLTQN